MIVLILSRFGFVCAGCFVSLVSVGCLLYSGGFGSMTFV